MIALNTITYLTIFDRSLGIGWLALLVMLVAWAYAIPVAVLEPYRRMAFLMGSLFTAVSDVVLIGFWLVATGGYDSPYYLLWYASIASLAFRYDYRRTILAAVLDGVCYAVLLLALGELLAHPLEVTLRIGYIFIVGAIGAEAAREGYNQARLRLALRDQVRSLEADEARLQYQSLHDPLTGLPNRVLLHDRLKNAISASARDGSLVALLLLDLDYFKEVNDTFGHEWGDRILQSAALRLKRAVREADTVARLGGDEFAIVLTGLQHSGDAEVVARKLLSCLDAPFEVDGQSLSVRGSIGVALSPLHGRDFEALMRRADAAMYAAKGHRNGFVTYDVQHDEVSAERLRLTGELRRALEGGQLVLHYQPQVDFEGEGRIGVDTLVLWRHPTLGLLEPGRFVPLAERTATIRELATWTVDAALKQVRAWQETGHTIRAAVAVSSRMLQDEQLPDLIRQALERWRVPAPRLTLQVPEATLMGHASRARDDLGRLTSLGIGLSLADFGVGQCSLAYLKQLPLSELRIGRAFVADMLADEKSEGVVRSIIGLAHNLGLEVLADGIDEEAVWRRLQIMGCDRGQGYYLGKPMDAEQLEEWLATSPWATPNRPPRPRNWRRRLEIAGA